MIGPGKHRVVLRERRRLRLRELPRMVWTGRDPRDVWVGLAETVGPALMLEPDPIAPGPFRQGTLHPTLDLTTEGVEEMVTVPAGLFVDPMPYPPHQKASCSGDWTACRCLCWDCVHDVHRGP